jgi:hypothetical protein
MAVSLESEELRLAKELELTGMKRPAAILAVVMVTRAHARPEDELIEILRQYPGLESMEAARRAVSSLKKTGWIISVMSYGVKLVQQAPDLRTLIADRIGAPAAADRLLEMRASLEPFVNVVGPMSDERVYVTFMDLLRNAQREICLPMLATTPYLETVTILRDRATAGIRVRIILGAPSLVARWRGESMRSIAQQRILEWKREFSEFASVQIRISRIARDMEIATCALVDGRVARLDIYDPYTQRSLEGVMVELISPPGRSLNIVNLFQRAFDSAWGRSYTTGRWAKLQWVLQRWWKVWLGVVILAIGLIPIPLQYWSIIMTGIGVGVLAPTIVDEGPGLWAIITRRTG